MYEPITNFYPLVVQSQTRRITWGGTITADGTDYTFTAENIVGGSGRIINEISGSVMELGTVFSSELDIGIYIDDIGVPRDKIYGATILLECTMTANNTTGTVPMGVFTVVEAKQSGAVCSIVAYDGMSAFDIEYPVESGVNRPYDWAVIFCAACGVSLGTSREEFEAMPNGTVSLMLTWEDTIKTYRDALGMLAAAIGCSAHMSRFGLLEFYPLKNTASVATIRANDRFSSGIAQTSWTPRSVYVSNTETGNITKVGSGNLMLDLGDNCFLQSPGYNRDIEWQITTREPVSSMLTHIYTEANAVTVVPVDADIPLNPCLDLYDIVTLTGAQANNTKVIITSLIHTIGGATQLKCAGENTTEEPKPSNSSGSSQNDKFWLVTAYSDPDQDIEIGTMLLTWGDAENYTWEELGDYTWGDIVAGGTETVIVTGYFTPPKELSRGVMAFSVNYTLTSDATVTYSLYIDDDPVWTVTETQKAGKIAKTITTPMQIWARQPGTYSFIATMAGVNS